MFADSLSPPKILSVWLYRQEVKCTNDGREQKHNQAQAALTRRYLWQQLLSLIP
ncbi:MAG: hypothetical protein ABIG61_11440 [Planctomycetota bacterium]